MNDKPRCLAYRGNSDKQCLLGASTKRDGRPVCGQHDRAIRVRFADPPPPERLDAFNQLILECQLETATELLAAWLFHSPAQNDTIEATRAFLALLTPKEGQ